MLWSFLNIQFYSGFIVKAWFNKMHRMWKLLLILLIHFFSKNFEAHFLSQWTDFVKKLNFLCIPKKTHPAIQ